MKEVYEGIVSFLKNYQERTHVKGYVLGISGGKDSTVVAKLLVDSICDGGGTFFAIYKALQDMGVTDVHLRVTHAIQKEPLVKLSELYKTITITNSYKDWDKEELPNNIKVIEVYE